ncbi:hypothetical protein Y032_0030g2134 [Ancylostoma ceylanicum]|uniref:Uncharacterized protein n=1 Tax=Ancylostoma ceylanicum TaxID=53326 RepID=A0A016USX7_9BILA|nr:hypothetical protein Y032_0030g2134 [Ancylostoma ceylanicum]
MYEKVANFDSYLDLQVFWYTFHRLEDQQQRERSEQEKKPESPALAGRSGWYIYKGDPVYFPKDPVFFGGFDVFLEFEKHLCAQQPEYVQMWDCDELTHCL